MLFRSIFAQSYGFGPNYDQRDTVRRDVDLIRSMPGVMAVSPINGIPMSGGGRSSSFGRVPDPLKITTNVNIYDVDEHGLAALGVKLVEGRAFSEQEVQYNPTANNDDFVPSVIVTRAVAHALYGDESALGKPIFDYLGQSAVVVGVIDNMLNAWVDFDDPSHVLLQPRISSGPIARYAIRTELYGDRKSVV